MLSVTQSRITVLNPTAPPRELRRAMAARRPDRRGRSIGFLGNAKSPRRLTDSVTAKAAARLETVIAGLTGPV